MIKSSLSVFFCLVAMLLVLALVPSLDAQVIEKGKDMLKKFLKLSRSEIDQGLDFLQIK